MSTQTFDLSDTTNIVYDSNRVHKLKLDGTEIWKRKLEDFTWSEIAEISESGKAQDYFSIGDEKTLTGFGVVQILGFNHDNLSNGLGKAGITFGLKDLSDDSVAMLYSDNTTWEGSNGQYICNNSIFTSLPSDLQDNIKEVTKISMVQYGSEVEQTTIETNDKVWMFSCKEVYNLYSDGEQYAYWALHNTDSDKIKKYNGVATAWWLRSRHSSSFFGMVTYQGTLISYLGYNSNSIGCCFGFCI